jgi:hypothetical protein
MRESPQWCSSYSGTRPGLKYKPSVTNPKLLQLIYPPARPQHSSKHRHTEVAKQHTQAA